MDNQQDSGMSGAMWVIVVILLLIIIGILWYVFAPHNTTVLPTTTTNNSTTTEENIYTGNSTGTGASVTASTSVKTYPDNGVNGS